jgi:kynureninase
VTITRADADALDRSNPLASTRDRFLLPDGTINLDGNSLGSPPRAVAAHLEQVVRQEWAERLIRSWDETWWEMPVRVGDRIGALAGAAPGQIVVGDSTSVCLYRALGAALALAPGKQWVVYDVDDFPTDRYLIEAVAGAHGKQVEGVHRDDIVGALCHDTAVVVASHVDYRTAAVLDMPTVTAACHAHGALVLWDLSHSIGALPVQLDASGVDLAVGCTYKHLNGGPGAPAFTYVARRHHERAVNVLPGWVGHADPFAMEPGYRAATGIRRMLTGTPPVLGLAALDAALDAFEGVPLADLRAVSTSLTDLLIRLVDERLGWEVVSPRDAARRGGHVSVRHAHAGRLVQDLAAHGVIADARTTGAGAPDLLRFGIAALYVRHVDLWDAVDVLVRLDRAG